MSYDVCRVCNLHFNSLTAKTNLLYIMKNLKLSAITSRPLGVQTGFTLLELLVVMVIIGLLAGYVGPKYFAQIGKSEVKSARAQIDSLGKAIDQFRLDTGHYPSSGATPIFTNFLASMGNMI
jgi:prepilin-type N-terminal cleavage/methylation domain-containing protein